MSAHAYTLVEPLIPAGWKGTPVEMAAVASGGPAVRSVQRVPARRFYAEFGALEGLKPIEVALSDAEDGVVAEIASLQLAASGENVSEAMSSLSNQLVHFYDYYSALPEDRVTGLAARLRKTYVDYFRRLMPRA